LPVFFLYRIFSTSLSGRTLQKPSCSINISGRVCVNVCGTSAWTQTVAWVENLENEFFESAILVI
jgi:hypothetical protein